jgi:hypothetical protein
MSDVGRWPIPTLPRTGLLLVSGKIFNFPKDAFSFPIRRRIDVDHADAIESVLPLDYGEGLTFLVHVEFLPVQSPPGRLPLRAASDAVCMLQEAFIVSKYLNIASSSFDEQYRHRKRRPLSDARRLGGDHNIFPDYGRAGYVAVGESYGVSYDRHGAHKPIDTRCRFSVKRRADPFGWIDATVKGKALPLVRIEEGNPHLNLVLHGCETVCDVRVPRKTAGSHNGNAKCKKKRLAVHSSPRVLWNIVAAKSQGATQRFTRSESSVEKDLWQLA